MFDSILHFLNGPEPDPGMALDQTMVAAAAVMIEAAGMDDHFHPDELKAIRRILGERFGLAPKDTERLIAAAERANAETSQLFRFTHILVTRLTPEQRIPIIEMMWEVAYADGVLSPEEDGLIRRIAGLLYVSDRDRGLARQRVLHRLGIDP
ncbi:MAG TPA: TerB family tellurite resistance protein [Magnetospirillaceae bacterium]|jgi:uncharacterized tellurite resistance protein B-like protein